MSAQASEGTAATTFDAIVIGAGPAGEVCSGRLGEAGLRVALVEKHLIGGECSFYACMPSKALLRPEEALEETRRIPGAREALTGELDVEAVLRRRDEVIHNRDDSGMLPWLDGRGVTVVRGVARIVGERRVEVDGRTLEARRAVVVATGTEAAVPPIPGLAEANAWTNREATTSHHVPERLIVLGGGVVGVELGQAWQSLGSQVTIVEAQPRLLGREEEFAATLVHDALVASGIEVRVGVPAVEVTRNGSVALRLDSGDELVGDELLVAVGRQPATRELGLESVGLEAGKSIEVDETLRVPGTDWLYAIGDVNGRALLTHMGKYQARIAADVILSRDARLDPRAGDALSPRVVFTDPQVAAVGHTLESALGAGIEATAVDHETSGVAGGSFYGRGAPGTSRLVVDDRRRVLAGATFVGAEVAEFVHAATIAVVGEVPLELLWHATPCFPTRSEVWLRLLERYGL
jgi:dihydrolipoamide dehydrogenase